MAQVFNTETGQWEEQEDLGSSISNTSALNKGPGLEGIYSQQTAYSSIPFGGYRSAEDQKTWSNPKIASMYGGYKADGSTLTPADAGFSEYTRRAQEGGMAEAARQAAEDSGGFFDNPFSIAALGAGLYFGLPAMFGAEAAGGAAALSAADAASLASVSPWAADAAVGLGPLEAAAAAGAASAWDYGPNLSDFSGPSGWDFGPGIGDLAASNSIDAMGFDNILNSVAEATNSFNPAYSFDLPANIEAGLQTFSNSGINNPITSPYTPDFGTLADADMAVNVGAGQGVPEGFGMEGIGSTPAMDTLGSTNKWQSYINTIKGGGMNMWDALTTPIGGGSKGGLIKPPTPLGIAGRGLSALFDINSNKKAMESMRGFMDQANNWNDPNRARGDFANQQWQNSFTNPRGAFDEFMAGSGREFVDQARAQAAKSGRRGAYLNSGKLQSDLASLFMKQLPQYRDSVRGGFATGYNPSSVTASMAPAYANMIRNQYAPIGQAIRAVDRGFELADLFGG